MATATNDDKAVDPIRATLKQWYYSLQGRFNGKAIWERHLNQSEREKFVEEFDDPFLSESGRWMIEKWAHIKGVSVGRATCELALRFGMPRADYRWVVDSLPDGRSRLRNGGVNETRGRMVSAELNGRHTYKTDTGRAVHIYTRDECYIARGWWEGQAYGVTLGSDPARAEGAMRRLQTELEAGTFVPPSMNADRQINTKVCLPISTRQLVDLFLTDKRKKLGSDTAANYASRLTHLLEYADDAAILRKYKHASNVDYNFAVDFSRFLRSRRVKPNGKPGADEVPISPRQIHNVLDTARSLFNWAKQPKINKLPASFLNPFDNEIVGQPPKKDPLRPNPWPLEARIRLVGAMDAWQLCHFAIPLVLPLRPEDYCGLLIQEVDFDRRTLQFGFRADGHDFNKGRQSFRTPYPVEIEPYLRLCMGERTAGPLLRSRAVFEGRRSPSRTVSSSCDVDRLFQTAIASANAKHVQCANDAKGVIRSTILKMGGVSEDAMGKEFRTLRDRAGCGDGRLYDLRGACNTEMHRHGVSLLAQRYLTGHTLQDIQAEYVSLDPATEMAPYFASLTPLFTAMAARAAELGLRVDLSPAGKEADLAVGSAAV
jgi:integrase